MGVTDGFIFELFSNLYKGASHLLGTLVFERIQGGRREGVNLGYTVL